MNTRSRAAALAVSAVLLAAVAVTYTVSHDAESAPASGRTSADGRRLQFLANGRLSYTSPPGSRRVTSVACDRAYAAAGTVACLRPVGALSAGALVVMDAGLRERRRVPLTGFPNRLRVSASGRMVAWTLFIDGHSYATTGFSTRAGILDTRTGRLVTTLEDFTIIKDGAPYRNRDVNFWGVTFAADDNRFYATLSTGGGRHLVQGDFAARTVRTLAPGVECPSLSPDGTRLAFKSAVAGNPKRGWRLSTLDLATLRRTPLAETRGVDDQPVWLDGRTVGYTLQLSDGTNQTWAVPASGGGRPRLLLDNASSVSPPP
ncbi:PD40 domain-containing protein [Actinomadura sp. NEAU-AAG7]|uniref:PD40 domain-containing protein n=1 Tax=Actinomadura sp. NEAU-AAG7 TaxID=2839640 RepID=UPI001BE42808|nr:PD40 domain-containing protein [Actinomadura sp. NEAU-AAG7]MBT2212656.1 PD40 domain-containing protein [Actinomadura sp. NEAU-AAG7]